jgi:hypothetical protein
MDQLMVSFQRWAGSADEDIYLFLVGGKNCSWQLNEGHDGRSDGLGSKIGPKPPPRYHGSSHQGLSIGVIKRSGSSVKLFYLFPKYKM